MASYRSLRIFLALTAILITSPGFAVPAAPVAAADPRIVDDFERALQAGRDANGIPIGFFTAQDSNSSVAFEQTDAPPAPVPDIPPPNTVLKMTFNVSAFGVVIHGFENDAVNQWITQDWSAYEGLAFWLYGTRSGTDLFVDVIDNRNPGSTRDDAERFTVTLEDNFSGWQYIELPFERFVRKEIGNGAPNDGFTLTEVHGWAFGTLTTTGAQTYYLDNVTLYGTAPARPLTVGFAANTFNVREGGTGRVTVRLSQPAATPISVNYTTQPGLATAGRDYTPTEGTLTFAPGVVQQTFNVATLDDTKFEADESVLLYLSEPSGAALGLPNLARLNIQDNEAYDPELIDDFERGAYLFGMQRNAALATPEIAAHDPLALPGQGAYEHILQARSSTPGRSSFLFGRRFALGEDWSTASGLSFWYYGRNSGRKIKVHLLDNQAPDPGPPGWQLAWSDEFNAPAGTPPNPNIWTHEIGDGTANGIPGWGNSELEYYTDSTQNAAHDGQGNLLITVRAAGENSALRCYYGPCRYTSARLISWRKVEFAYGRIEARIKVPAGAGYWPAFWSLGTNIDRVGWPQAGEIDFMEFVGREPNRIFGTIHGPGYSGGNSFGGIHDFATPVPNAYHTYTVEWRPTTITWYVDGIPYHQATPADVAPHPWVFDHPFFVLLNVAVGGNFGGPVGDDTRFPQSMAVDYIRLYQAPDTAERFQATFTDNFSGWQRITIPFSAFARSSEQPAGAPNDGLTLTSVWGYAFEVPGGMRDPVLIDQVRLKGACADVVTVESPGDSGEGTLRDALAEVCPGGTIRFAATLAGQTIRLTSGELTIARSLTIDGTDAPGLTLSGGGTVRVFTINPYVAATIHQLTIADGYGFELAGAVLNNGTLTLDHVTIAGSRVTTSGQDFWKGGAGIYNGSGSTLTVRNSTIRDNHTEGADGGGIYAFFDTLLTIENSTISGNTASNVAGGIRTLGDATIVNSTISGNAALGWHGGAIFHTDGTMTIVHSTIADNSAPAGGQSGVFVGTFTDSSPRLVLTNSIVAGNLGSQCFVGRFGAGEVTLASGGHNLASDASCNLMASGDQPNTDPRIGPLADNGGPTLTHALLAGSPAIDAADMSVCPATDQRGVQRPQGAGCDIGAYEAGP
jgi:beta-glucanase (GH16 family)